MSDIILPSAPAQVCGCLPPLTFTSIHSGMIHPPICARHRPKAGRRSLLKLTSPHKSCFILMTFYLHGDMRGVNPASQRKYTHTLTENREPYILPSFLCVCVSGETPSHTQFMKCVRRRSSLVGRLLVSQGGFPTRGSGLPETHTG